MPQTLPSGRSECMPGLDLTLYPPEYLDAFAAWCHLETPGVEIIEDRDVAAESDAPHGRNTPEEMAV